MTGCSLGPEYQATACERNDNHGELGASVEALNPLSYLPLVRSIAGQILRTLPKQVELEDLVQAGVLGLLDAFRKYDQSKEIKFSSYAHFRIRGAILDSLRCNDWCPRELRRKARRFRQTEHSLVAELGRAAEAEEVAAEMSMPLNEYNALRSQIHSATVGSLEEFLEVDDGSARQTVADLRQAPVTDELIRRQREERMADFMQKLPEREKSVLTLYYFEELTMKEIAAVLEVGESRVSQIHSAAVERLRRAMAGC